MRSDRLVSVIMPVKNLNRYVSESIDSILSQSLRDLELLIVDDHSSDNTLEICRQFAKKDARVKIFSSPGQGVSAARNFALREAQGDFVANADGDDISLPQRLAKQREYLQTAEIDYLGTFVRLIDPQGLHLIAVTRPTSHDAIYRELRKGDGSALLNTTVMSRRHLIEEVGAFDEQLGYLEDLDLMLRVGVKYRFGTLPEILVLYRQHRASLNYTVDFERQNQIRSMVLKRNAGLHGTGGGEDYVTETDARSYTPVTVEWPERYRRWAWQVLFNEENRIHSLRIYLKGLSMDPFNRQNISFLNSFFRSYFLPKSRW